ncbi:ORF-21 [Teiidae poxvirus 1]|nr:ORF-21 [Teiidae poxvirus 1]
MNNINNINSVLAFVGTKFYNHLRKTERGNILVSPPGIMAIVNTLLKSSTDRTKYQFLDNFRILTEEHNVEQMLVEILSSTQYESLYLIDTKKKLNLNYKRYMNKSDISTIVIGELTTLCDIMKRLNYSLEDILSVAEEYFDSAFVFDIRYTGLWETQFMDYDSHRFSVTRFTVKAVPYMITSGMLGYIYYHEVRAHIVNIPYLHNTYSLCLIFADTYRNFKYLESRLTPSVLLSTKTIFSNMIYTDITISFPKFSAVTHHDLKSVFEKIGITDLFDNNASMKSLSPDTIPLTKLCMKVQVDFLNNRFLLTDQKRWENVSKNRFHLDKPFMFLIKYNKTNSILFLGKVKDPSQ